MGLLEKKPKNIIFYVKQNNYAVASSACFCITLRILSEYVLITCVDEHKKCLIAKNRKKNVHEVI